MTSIWAHIRNNKKCSDEPSTKVFKISPNLDEIDPFKIYSIGFDQQCIFWLPSCENRF